jgi:lipoate-protein ligase A
MKTVRSGGVLIFRLLYNRAELMQMRAAGEPAYIGCCCQPFFVKHMEDFRRSGVPGILLDIDNTTCYELDQAKRAYAGQFGNQTSLNIGLLHSVLDAIRTL